MPIAGYPGVNGSPASFLTVPRCAPDGGSHIECGYTSSVCPLAQSAGSEYNMIPIAPCLAACCD